MPEQKKTGYPSIDKPWLKYYKTSSIDEVYPDWSVYEALYYRNQDNLNRVALQFYGTKINYGELLKQIDQISGIFSSIGIRSHDVVTIAMLNDPIAVILFYALNKIGAVANYIYPFTTEAEKKNCFEGKQTKMLFVQDLFADQFKGITQEYKIPMTVMVPVAEMMSPLKRFFAQNVKGMRYKNQAEKWFVRWEHFIKMPSQASVAANDPDDTAVMIYTGGTTGGSKAVEISNRAILSCVYQYYATGIRLKRNHTWAMILPLFIAYGICCALQAPLLFGMTALLRFPVTDNLEEVMRFKPNHITTGPLVWENYIKTKTGRSHKFLIAPISGGDRLTEHLEERINQYLAEHDAPSSILNGYGMSEVCGAVCINQPGAYKAGSVGIPFVKNIVSAFHPETGEECTVNEKGELCLSGPTIMKGYFNNPEETNQVLRRHADGRLWIHSGDWGYVDEDGFVFVEGRLKRYFLTKYEVLLKKVFSLDIERTLMKCELVENIAVVPMDDAERGQVAVAYIILKDQDINKEEAEKELRTFAKENMDYIYRPVRYRFVDNYPHTRVGKIDYLKLTQETNDENLREINLGK